MNEKHKSTLVKYQNILKNELGYANATIKTYSSHLKEYFGYFDKSALHLTKIDYKWFIQNHSFEHSKHNQFISSVKLFYLHILKVKIKSDDFNRPRKERKLPNILSVEEKDRLINSYDNIKHKCLMATIYYFGLRRSEAKSLKRSDFDKGRELLHIRNSKQNKDRFIPFQDKWRDIANKYVLECNIKDLMFIGQYGEEYSFESMSNVLKQGLKRCGITKHITLHCLRHSFAVHLLEKGLDIYIVSKLLGHANVKTTETYLQMTNKCYDQVIL